MRCVPEAGCNVRHPLRWQMSPPRLRCSAAPKGGVPTERPVRGRTENDKQRLYPMTERGGVAGARRSVYCGDEWGGPVRGDIRVATAAEFSGTSWTTGSRKVTARMRCRWKKVPYSVTTDSLLLFVFTFRRDIFFTGILSVLIDCGSKYGNTAKLHNVVASCNLILVAYFFVSLYCLLQLCVDCNIFAISFNLRNCFSIA